MNNCECLSGCPFFNDKMGNMPSLASMYKKNYCMTDNTNCARYMVFKKLGKEKVPFDLFPNEKEIAEKIINKG